MTNKLRKKFEKMTNPHKITFFLAIIILTIVITRLFVVLIHNPNPSIFGFEIHHLDYGIALLMWTSLLVIFGKRKHISHLILYGISFGLILDDIWFIRSNIIDPSDIAEVSIYNATLLSTIILTGIIFAIALLIWKVTKRKIKSYNHK